MIFRFTGERGGLVFTDDQEGYNYVYQRMGRGRIYLRCVNHPLAKKRSRVKAAVCKGRGSFDVGDESLEEATIRISESCQHICEPDPLYRHVCMFKRNLFKYAHSNPSLPASQIWNNVAHEYDASVTVRAPLAAMHRSINRAKSRKETEISATFEELEPFLATSIIDNGEGNPTLFQLTRMKADTEVDSKVEINMAQGVPGEGTSIEPSSSFTSEEKRSEGVPVSARGTKRKMSKIREIGNNIREHDSLPKMEMPQRKFLRISRQEINEIVRELNQKFAATLDAKLIPLQNSISKLVTDVKRIEENQKKMYCYSEEENSSKNRTVRYKFVSSGNFYAGGVLILLNADIQMKYPTILELMRNEHR